MDNVYKASVPLSFGIAGVRRGVDMKALCLVLELRLNTGCTCIKSSTLESICSSFRSSSCLSFSSQVSKTRSRKEGCRKNNEGSRKYVHSVLKD